MTEWVLIVMMCSRWCTPQYAVVYPTKEACVAQIPEPVSNWKLPTRYCVPLIKEK